MKFEKGGGSQFGKPTCAKCGKRHYGECLLSTECCFWFGKYGQRVRDCLTRNGKQVATNVLNDDAPKKTHFYALHARGAKTY